MQPDAAFGAIFGVLFLGIALGGWLCGRRLDPRALKRWYPRFSVLAIGALTPFLVAPVVIWGEYMSAAIACVVAATIAYIIVAKTRVCESCGTVTQPQDLVTPASFCPKCGVELSANKLFG